MKKSCPSINHCELCGEEASLYCAADSAFLCFRCDRRVHAANFLVARHVRRLTCPSCHSLAGSGSSAALLLSGSDPAIPLIRPLCSSCAPDGPSASSSSCISSDDESTSAPPPPPRKPWAEGCTKRTIAHWSRRIGMEGVAGVAAHVLRACDGGGGGGMAVVPPRASMAAAILYAAKVCFCRRGGDRVCGEVVRRLERCSGVPAELILAAESRIARAVRTRARAAAEGWADSECS